MAQMRDTLEKVWAAKELSIVIAGILDNMRHGAGPINDQQQLESQLHQFNLQAAASGPKVEIGQNVVGQEGNEQAVPTLTEQFRNGASKKLTLLTDTVEQLGTDVITTWKHERQRSINGINSSDAITLDQLQGWCIPIADLIWELYNQLQEAARIFQNGVIQTGKEDYLHFVEKSTDDVVNLIQRFLSHTFLVVEQPQVIVTNWKYTKRLVASLLTGRNFDIDRDPPTVLVSLIDEQQARIRSAVDNSIEASENVINDVALMKFKEESNMLNATFDTMRISKVHRERWSFGGPLLMRQKHCLYLSFTMTFGSRTIKVSTISLPVITVPQTKLESLASRIITWYNAFAPMWKVPFEVPQTAKWSEVVQILQAKYREATEGHELTEENLAYLASKAFRNVQPQPETVSFGSLCFDSLNPNPNPNHWNSFSSFSFWSWFHSILKFIQNKKIDLKEMIKTGLVTGFIDRESAEALVAKEKPGTFLLRFPDSVLGGISITAACTVDGQVVGRSFQPYTDYNLRCHNHKLATRIKELGSSLQWLYQVPVSIAKDVAFGPFYDEEPIQEGPIIPIICQLPRII